VTASKQVGCGDELKVLAGDVGGTNSRLAIYDGGSVGLRQITRSTYPSAEYSCVAEIISEFLASNEVHCDVVCLGLPGPVSSERIIRLTNLPWKIDRERLRNTVHTENIGLINDVQASAVGVHALSDSGFDCLHEGEAAREGNRAVISIGTGLGVAGLTATGHAFATEAGHASFSPRTHVEVELMRELSLEFDHVSWERVASGPALRRIYRFLTQTKDEAPDAPEIVSRIGSDPMCEQTVLMFARFIGAVVGNIALTLMATGGVYLCGGVAPKIVDAVGKPPILDALFDKGRMRPLLESVPVFLVRDDNLALTGAAHTGIRLLNLT
jgi:glucokinase